MKTTNTKLRKLQKIVIVLVAIISFTMSACKGNTSGGGGIATNVRFRNATPPANINMSVARSVMGGTTEHPTAFVPLNNFYTALGSKVASYTPTKFEVREGGIMVMVNGTTVPFTDATLALVDFAQGTTVVPYNEAEAGITVTAMGVLGVTYLYDDNRVPAKTTFTIDGQLVPNHPYRTYVNPGTGRNDITVSDSNGKSTITMPTALLIPRGDGNYPGVDSNIVLAINCPQDISIIYHGTQYNVGSTLNNSNTGGLLSAMYGTAVLIPWAGVSIPSSASSITFNVNFDLNGIIEQYGTGEDMRFVLANRFWDRYSLTTSIN